MSAALNEVAALVGRETGIVLKQPQLASLEAAMRRVSPEMNAESLLSRLSKETGRSLLGRLIDEVTVKETYFMREPRDLRAIDWWQLREAAVARGAGVIRVWVAACATGEEAYTLAILASEALGQASPPVSILATDISDAALEGAAAGVYSQRAIRSLSPELRERYLIGDGSRWSVRDSLRPLVAFGNHNLITDQSPPGGGPQFDVITCRNVLIYFDADTVEAVIGSLESALLPDGSLILGAADRLTGTSGRLARLARDGAPVTDRREPQSVARPVDPSRRPEVGRTPAYPRRRAEDRIEDAVAAADGGNLAQAVEITARVLEEDPLAADAYFVHGLAELRLGDADAAARSLRRALYVDPAFSLAAFQLGRAHDVRGDRHAARRAYEQALRTLDPDDDHHRVILDQVDVGDIAAACAARLATAERGN
jgi:chemotaxis protein methyltransferase CheR